MCTTVTSIDKFVPLQRKEFLNIHLIDMICLLYQVVLIIIGIVKVIFN